MNRISPNSENLVQTLACLKRRAIIPILVVLISLNHTLQAAIVAGGGLFGDYGPTYDGVSDPWPIFGAPLEIGRTTFGAVSVSGGSEIAILANPYSLGIGVQSSGLGILEISGTDSEVRVSHQGVIGDEGTGSVNVLDGGILKMVAGALDLGSQATGEGFVTISGADSVLSAVGGVRVGVAGSGQLRIADGGSVSVPLANVSVPLTLNANGQIIFGAAPGDVPTAPGYLDALLVQGDPGGTIHFNHNATGFALNSINTPVADTTLQGGIAVNHIGTGETILYGINRYSSEVNTYSGGTTLTSGTLVVTDNHSLGTGSVTINGGTLATLAAANLSNDFVIKNDFNVYPDGVFDFFNLAPDPSFHLSGSINLDGGQRVITDTLGETLNRTVFSGEISNGGLTLANGSATGPALFEMRGNVANTYTGDTIVQSRVGLILTQGSGITAISGDAVIEDGGFMTIEANEQIADTSTIRVEGSGVIQVGLNNDVTETIGELDGSGSPAASIEISDNTTGSLLRIGSGNFSGVIEGGVGGSTSIEKIGADVLTLSGANTYTGNTTVSDGTLLVNNTTGSGTGTGDVTVNNGGTLGGEGTISGNVMVNTGGTLSPGNSPGTLTVDGDLTLAGLTVIEIASAASFDQIDVGGALTYGGDLSFDFGFTPLLTDTFDIFDFTSQSGTFANINFSNPEIIGTFDNATGVLSLTAVPEPEMFGLLAGLLGLGLAACRRRR